MAPLDAVRALCLENPVTGGTQIALAQRELDPSQDALTAAGVFLQNASNSASDKTTLVSRSAAGMTFQDINVSRVLGELVSSTRGASSAHQSLLDVIHFLNDGPGDGWASGAVCQDNYSGLLLVSSTWYTDATQSKRIVAQSWTYSGLLIATEKTILYAADGVSIVRSVTDTYSYSGSIRTQRTRTWGTT